MLNIAPDRLRELVTELFVTAGTDTADAVMTADHLVTANQKGHDSHGVVMVPSYVEGIRRGTLNPNAHIEIIRECGSVVLIDGLRGFGQVVGFEATEVGIERAKANGIASIGLRNAHHLGRIGTYGEMCAEAGLVSVHFVNVVGHHPAVVPYGGAEPRLQTNPFCVAVPRDHEPPIVLDMATSVIALGKVKVAHNAGKPIRDGVLVDSEGQPTNDPSVMYTHPAGAVLPFGLYKGYGLSLMCELLGGGLVGEWTMQPEHERAGTTFNHMLMFILNPQAFGGTDAFQREVSAMVNYVQSTKPVREIDKVRIPGEPEREALEEREAGIPLDDQTWSELLGAAKAAGMEQESIRYFSE